MGWDDDWAAQKACIHATVEGRPEHCHRDGRVLATIEKKTRRHDRATGARIVTVVHRCPARPYRIQGHEWHEAWPPPPPPAPPRPLTSTAVTLPGFGQQTTLRSVHNDHVEHLLSRTHR